MPQFDFLVIGSGIAGLSYAAKLARHFDALKEKISIAVITKVQADETNTKYAQGGIAAVWAEEDSFEKHIDDTMVAGGGISKRSIVEIVVKEAPERIMELISYGTRFDKEADGEYDLAKEGGHSDHRILHFKDATGAEIERALLDEVKSHSSIQIFTHYFAVDLITQHHLGETVYRHRDDIKCFGAYVLNTKTGKVEKFLAKTTMLATGGIGNIYQNTTNPRIATGDGIAMAYRAKGVCDNMEFIQFHPTALYQPGKKPNFLISEAVRGFGGVLRNKKGETFMEHYDPRLSLAPRDIVARSIDSEMKKYGDEHVYIDVTHCDYEKFIEHFPNITAYCHDHLGIDVRKDYIPVVPAQHYMCGGIKVNEFGQTNIFYLYAAGECACTGLHGANRLASNSLLEAVVFAHRAFLKTIEHLDDAYVPDNIPEWNDEGTTHPEEAILVTEMAKELESIMSNYVGIVRTNRRLQRAHDRLELIFKEHEDLYRQSKVSVPIMELRNMINVSYLVLKMAMARRENVGLHFNLDHVKK
ncbi:L-aspartate oxidase [Runella slithyformis]|uniref:L-aspartate oxidase n=1 Tax=Runella slithyformis (strain ATCC 29530 / DSM 19594 / LMG 11500 / NCIMB 11436 / LSU 4) TaxID=761193 RepID=A0A7U4E4X2_RUNSL|nr:L-aspartate oxidase [Runella slithyformis]AEI47593.1 L-aspartate oxidase [Runella slithyformis DSM 19594]